MKKILSLMVIGLLACEQPAPPIADKAATTETAAADESGPLTQGANHIGFAVSDLTASTEFFTNILEWNEVGGNPSYPSRFVSDGQIFVTLWQTNQDEPAISFNRKTNVGLHHFAITVPDLETLDVLHERFQNAANVKVEFAPEFLGGGPTTHMMIREPSGLRLEFIVPGGKRRASK